MRRKILIIEDDVILGPIYADRLRDAGYDVELCRRMGEAHDRLRIKKISYDLVILDLIMELDGVFEQNSEYRDRIGVALLQKLRAANITTKVVVLSILGAQTEVQSLAKTLTNVTVLDKREYDPKALVEFVKTVLQ